MKKIKKALRIIIPLIIGIFLYSCEKEEPEFSKDLYQDDNLITKKSAENIAENILFEKYVDGNSKSFKKSKKEIKKTLEVPDSINSPAYYIINYLEGGFIILSGDKRSEPILAFSEKNNFDVEVEHYPSGLVDWLYNTKKSIEKIRRDDLKIKPETAEQWANLLNDDADILYSKKTAPLDPDEPDCTSYTIQKGPLLETVWGQGCGYNSLTPNMSCGPCGHAWTGCVATSMAQIMKFYQYPNNYTWANMPNTFGTNTTATLMLNIGNAVNMNYKCDGSGADTKEEVASSFRNDFGYSSATYSDYNYQTVRNELNNNRPVILKGGRNTGWWIFGQYSDGHAWVCDGYLNDVNPCSSSILKYHMNWGWDGSYNGWYSFNNFNPGDNTFNYKTGMIYNIKP